MHPGPLRDVVVYLIRPVECDPDTWVGCKRGAEKWPVRYPESHHLENQKIPDDSCL